MLLNEFRKDLSLVKYILMCPRYVLYSYILIHSTSMCITVKLTVTIYYVYNISDYMYESILLQPLAEV